MTTGEPPFDGCNDLDIMVKAANKNVSFKQDVWRNRSLECPDIISKMLEKRPIRRLNYLQCLNHNWFQLKDLDHDLENLADTANKNTI